MVVNIEEIQKTITLLLTNLKDKKGNKIELKNDFYWDISSDELYNPYDEPKDISLGQLSDDLSEIHRLSKAEGDGIPYDLKRISEILRALSIENSTVF
ncbi:MAG: hypothetical protein GKR88_05780 [Flavobacteriaceae bacterium]|nr:MAG: hypothetical protein GKR88_05780 [Flavobacteriaceae bacterium]